MSQTSTKPELEQLPTDLYRTKTSNFLRVLAAFMSYALVNMSWLIGAVLLSRSPQPFSPRFLFAFLGASAILIILYSIATTKAEHESASYGIAQVIKRLLDVVASATGLLVVTPFILFTALAIRIESSGPVFFRSARVGQYGAPITVLKFRTMYVAPSKTAVTRVGRLLRSISLNELPSLFTVLYGDLSLVGPYPRTPQNLARFIDKNRRILTVKPGMSGLATISGVEASQMVEKDLEYVNNWSLMLDLKILLRTIPAALTDVTPRKQS